jgi:hypothetical protein
MSVRMITNLLMNRYINMKMKREVVVDMNENNKPLIEYMPYGIQSVERR